MNIMKIKYFCCLFMLVLFISGCSAPSYNVEFFVSPKVKEQLSIYPSLEIDLIGVDVNEAERFENCPVDDYFLTQYPLRVSCPHVTFTFSEDSIVPKMIDTSHPIWQKWGKKNATQLYVLVNLPNLTKGKESGKDGRRIVIPLESSWLFGNDNRYFEITPMGISHLPDRPENYPDSENIINEGK